MDSSVNGFLLDVVEHKMTTPTVRLFFRAILCNWLVCLAFYPDVIEGRRGQNVCHDAVCILLLHFRIRAQRCQYVHLAIALVLNHPGTISLEGVLHNLIPVTIGNLIGGVSLMGFMYYFVNKPFLDAKESPGE